MCGTCRLAGEAEGRATDAASAADAAVADAVASVRGALAAAAGGAADSAATPPLSDINLAGLAAARLAAWRIRHPQASNYQVHGQL